MDGFALQATAIQVLRRSRATLTGPGLAGVWLYVRWQRSRPSLNTSGVKTALLMPSQRADLTRQPF